MKVHVIKAYGHNSSSSHNEFGEWLGGRRDADCDGWYHHQSRYYLLLEANLRDRVFDETKIEFTKWICRLSKRVNVTDILVNVCGQDKEMLITNAAPYDEMVEPFSWIDESNGEPAWTEYLFWDRAKGSSYPMILAHKYFADPENDAEVQRRLRYGRNDL